MAVIAWYALATGLGLADPRVAKLTQGGLSGQSAKHVVVALAAWPVVRAPHRAAAVTAPLGAAPTMR